MKTCLVVVDVQNDFCEGGSLAIDNASQIIGPINEIMGKYDCVVGTKDSHPQNHISFASVWKVEPFTVLQDEVRWPDHCVVNTPGWELHKDLKPISQIFEKGTGNTMGYSICENQDFVSFITQFKEVDVCGLAFDYCVKTCATDIAKHVPKVRVLKDLCKIIRLEDEKKVTEELQQAGVEVI